MALADIISLLHENRGRRLALSGHRRPDGDSLGSCLGLAEAFRSLGGRAVLVNPGAVPDKYAFLIDPGAIAVHEDPDWWREYDLMGVLDCGEAERLPDLNQEAVRRLPVFNLDHHVSSAGVGGAVWLEPEASSTCEMAVNLIREAGWALPPRAAQALWTGLVTDTGRFSQENATPAALEAARLCLLAGADPVLTEARVFQSVSAGERRLQGRLLERMRLLAAGRLAVASLRREDFRAADLDENGSYDLIRLLRDTAGVEVALLLAEAGGEEGVRATLRTAKPHDAVRTARLFGGGGHARAAGCTLAGGLEEAEKQLVAAALEYFPGA